MHESAAPVRELLFVYPFPASASEAYVALDLSDMGLSEGELGAYTVPMGEAYAQMAALEAGTLANPDEQRPVGHYWLRTPALAPTAAITQDIEASWHQLERLTRALHSGSWSPRGVPVRNVLWIGIGGSALGPQLLVQALQNDRSPVRTFFLDNTDPEGLARTLRAVQQTPAGLAGTLVVVVSKSGGTAETRNGCLETRAWFVRERLWFPAHAVAITSPDSALQRWAVQEGWLATLPLWEWVGGRTSLWSPVGLFLAALLGIEWRELLAGAAAMDVYTRTSDLQHNPAMLMAAAWLHAAQQGRREMVVLPYKDRLEGVARYLQQLVMESLGKEKNLQGQTVHEGIAVYGNKGSTDQHAYVQQLREGPNQFFAQFVEVTRDGATDAEEVFVEPGVTSGNYLLGFLLGTRRALAEQGRWSFTLTLPDLSAYTLGGLLALYERAVGYYALCVQVNAYHQPGVEAGKRAATAVLTMKQQLMQSLTEVPQSVALLCEKNGIPNCVDAWRVLEHEHASHRVMRIAGSTWTTTAYARFPKKS